MAKRFLYFVKEYGNWMVYNNSREMLGKLYYYNHWKQWVFEARHDTVWSHGCLNQIEEKLKELNAG